MMVKMFAMVALLAAVCWTHGADKEPHTRDAGLKLAQRRLIPQLQTKPVEGDAVARRHPWILEVTAEDAFWLAACDAWLFRLRVPDSTTPPYYNNNHHEELWVFADEAAEQLGRGAFFDLNQEVSGAAFRAFIDRACPERCRGDELFVATEYLRLNLAGRFPFDSFGAQGLPTWDWIGKPSHVPEEYAGEMRAVSDIPPATRERDKWREFRGCVQADVGLDHSDFGCWTFRFDVDDGGLLSVEETFRRQPSPGFLQDSGP